MNQNLITLSKYFADPESAREFMEQLRWKGEPVMPALWQYRRLRIKPESG